jgi:DNA helicase IV
LDLSVHPELESEQAYISEAYACLERTRSSTRQLAQLVETGAGGTHQARFERDVVEEKAADRLSRLELGAESLVFGRIDRLPVGDEIVSGGEKFYIGRLPVSDAEHNPVVIDWRAPVAEAFYRATGRNPIGLERRRHFSTEGEKLLGIDDEAFTVERLERDGGDGLVGSGALLAALGRARTGHMRDIVATIQTEQDEIIRAELPGVMVVQGGPGTGKTAVALHRASYLLYTHRFPLERQGVLVVGPNRHFIRYISRVLPALGETGVDLAGIDDLFAEGLAAARDPHDVAQVKGDLRMVKLIKRAVSTRQRHLREGLVIGVGSVELTITAAETAEMIAVVKRAHRVHNASRKHLQNLLVERLYQRYRTAMARHGRTTDEDGLLPYDDFAAQAKRHDDVKLSLDKMWPLLTPQMLLRDLFGAAALIKAASRELLTDDEQRLLLRARTNVDEVAWTSLDIPLLDEAQQLLGPLPKSAQIATQKNTGTGEVTHIDEGMRTYGHIVIDEAQDLAPMQLRMVARRSLSGSLTVVGDIGQATGMWAPKSWDEVLDYLPQKRSTRVVELTVGYRTPSEIMDLAARVLAVAAPDLRVPTSVRSTGDFPQFIVSSTSQSLAGDVVRAIDGLRELLGSGTIGVLCPDTLLPVVGDALDSSPHQLDPSGLQSDGVTLLPVRSAKGLEFDGVVVVEPARVVSESAQGLRALFVALTRSTRALTVVHHEALPECMSEVPAPVGSQHGS